MSTQRYAEFLAEQLNQNEGFQKISERFKSLKNEKVLLFPHDDPDGLTSGLIIETFLRSKGCSVRTVILPTYELSKKELTDNLKDERIVIIADKGTIGYYDDYTELAEILVIDHHPPQNGEIKKAKVFNPAIKNYTQTSASHLAHMVSTLCGLRDEKTDYLALVGMKADWAIEPATDFVCDYGKSLYEEVTFKYPGLVEKVKSRPTMFEVKQREVTTLLNQISEFYFVLSGGGFQYYYQDNQSSFAYQVLMKSEYSKWNEWKNFDEFLAATHQKDVSKNIFEKFKSDWQSLGALFDYSVLLKTVNTTKVYFFVGNNVLWMPMAGSVKLYDLKQKNSGSEVSLIMVNQEPNGGIHFSFRATGGDLHLGKLASDLAEALIAKYGHRGTISGGGHPVAAECKTRSAGVSIVDALKIFWELVDRL